MGMFPAWTGKRKAIYPWLAWIVIAVVVFGCLFPMGQLSLWNGEIPQHRNQYELMAEAILDGKLYIDYEEEDPLAQLENPYNPDAREEAGVEEHFDHAYYNGKYYMYFGVVPVFALFIPYRLLTGSSLTTYHATQVFVAFTIVGVFALFDMLRKRFFKELPPLTGLALATTFAVLIVQYSVAEPALYCTAITSALAFQIWSFYFFIKAVWVAEGENKQIALAAIGAFLGALSFGCRPTIAVSNLLVIPMLIVFLRQRAFTKVLLGKLALAATPYFVIGTLLMLYNYARFENPFEFGQSYQLTIYDISYYSSVFNWKKVQFMMRQLGYFWFEPVGVQGKFPFVAERGVLMNFPILLGLLGVFTPSFWKALRQHKLTLTVVGVCILLVVVSVLEILWSPQLLNRYQMDIYYLLAIICYLVIGFGFRQGNEKSKKLHSGIVISLCCVSLLLCVPYYFAKVAVYYPNMVDRIGHMLFG